MTTRVFAFGLGLALRELAFAAAFCGIGGVSIAAGPPVLIRAHAHNDYWHERPLLDALELGFASVEADVYLVNGELLVGHDPSELRADRTLEVLYLAPLRDRAQQQEGKIFDDGTRLTLLVDIKSEGLESYAALDKLLENYSDMMSRVVEGKSEPRAVDVVVSGNRPVEVIAADRKRYAAVDGRIRELSADPPVELVPLVSESWADHFRWDGQEEMSAEERAKLHEMAKQVHEKGRRLRFWSTPETEACWRELVAAEVDLIGTDDLNMLARFLNAMPAGGGATANTGRSSRRVPKN